MTVRYEPIDLSEFKYLLFEFAESCLLEAYSRAEKTNDMDKIRLSSDKLDGLMEDFFIDYAIMKQPWIYDDTEPFDDDPSYGYD